MVQISNAWLAYYTVEVYFDQQELSQLQRNHKLCAVARCRIAVNAVAKLLVQAKVSILLCFVQTPLTMYNTFSYVTVTLNVLFQDATNQR